MEKTATPNLTPLIDTLQLPAPIKDEGLLLRALTHRSWINEHAEESADNERLEFLGDAVLDLVVGAYLFKRFPEMQEGELTSLRAALVRSETFAEFSRELGINAHLRLGYGEDEHGGRDKTATLCAAFEAVIGALYLQQGIDAITPLVERLIEPTLKVVLEQSLHKDAKSEFQVYAQAELGTTPTYEVIAAVGPDHAKQFTVQVIINGENWGEGSGSSKRRAAQEAAKIALIKAGVEGWSADKS